jgi:Sulfate permease family
VLHARPAEALRIGLAQEVVPTGSHIQRRWNWPVDPPAGSCAGVLSVCAGVARLGFVADLLSRPVLVGYLAGVGLIMIAGQLGRVTGVRVSGSLMRRMVPEKWGLWPCHHLRRGAVLPVGGREPKKVCGQ